MTEYRWSIAQLEHKVDDGGVIIAHWRAEAIQDEHVASVYGSVSFTPNPDSEDFVPYSELTEGLVISWVKLELGEEVEAIENGLSIQIDNMVNPPVVAGLPWVTEPSTETPVVDNPPPLITPETLP
jgi:hypothetical protein